VSLEECASSIFRAELWKFRVLMCYIVLGGRSGQGALEDYQSESWEQEASWIPVRASRCKKPTLFRATRVEGWVKEKIKSVSFRPPQKGRSNHVEVCVFSERTFFQSFTV
jgi:hypothetical protein